MQRERAPKQPRKQPKPRPVAWCLNQTLLTRCSQSQNIGFFERTHGDLCRVANTTLFPAHAWTPADSLSQLLDPRHSPALIDMEHRFTFLTVGARPEDLLKPLYREGHACLCRWKPSRHCARRECPLSNKPVHIHSLACLCNLVYTRLVQVSKRARVDVVEAAATEGEGDACVHWTLVDPSVGTRPSVVAETCVCRICGLDCRSVDGLTTHIKCTHFSKLNIHIREIRFTRVEITMYKRDTSFDLPALSGDEWMFVHPARRDRSLPTVVSAEELAAAAALPASTVKLIGRACHSFLHPGQVLSQADLLSDSEDEFSRHEVNYVAQHKLLDEFEDISSGEKEMMALWNKYMLRFNVISDAHVAQLCLQFAQEHSAYLHTARLINNFKAHLKTLFDFGILDPPLMRDILDVLSKPSE